MELKTYFAQDAAGNIISSAIVNVFLHGTTTLATGLTRADGTPLENPFAADGAGRIQFRAPDGYYDVQVSAGQGIIQTLTIQCVDYSEAKADADRAEEAADRADVSAEQAQNSLNSITGINTNFEQNSREQWRRSLAEAGLTLVSGSFEEGATVNSSTDAVWHIAGGQCYTWDGALPKEVFAGSTPKTSGGISDTAWVIVSTDGGSVVSGISEIGEQQQTGVVTVLGFFSGTHFGGGDFYWEPYTPRSKHNGITIISPSVSWDGSYATLSNFLSGVGETEPDKEGCWIRLFDESTPIHTSWAGHDVTGVELANVPLKAAIRLAAGKGVRVSPGILKVGFDTAIGYKDKYLVTRQTALFLENQEVNLFAEGDVEVDISASTSPERVVFGLKNCTGTFSGFNWNSNFTEYSTAPSDTTHKPMEDWMGFMVEGCNVTIEKMRVNGSRTFVNGDALKGIANKFIALNKSEFHYNTNYCLITRNCDYSEFVDNVTYFSGRTWHTYGEDYAISENSRRSYANNNRFYTPISIQSRITPAGSNVTVTNNYYEGSGIFVEMFASDNVICTGNTSHITTDATGRASSHYLLITNDADNDWGVNQGLNNIVISGNIMQGGGIAVQGYNEGVQIKHGLIITDNTMTDVKAPRLTASSWVNTRFTGNKCKFAVGFGNLGIGGQFPHVTGNLLDGGYIELNPGYTVISPLFSDNVFRNTVGATLTTLFDMNDFTGGTFRNNDISASSFTKIFNNAANVNKVGFRYVDNGFSASPIVTYGDKCVVKPGDWVISDGAVTYGNPVAWVGSTSNTFLQINSAT